VKAKPFVSVSFGLDSAPNPEKAAKLMAQVIKTRLKAEAG
jgi:hypothetical protein